MAEGGAGETVATVKADERITIIVCQDILICIFQNVGTHIFIYSYHLFKYYRTNYDKQYFICKVLKALILLVFLAFYLYFNDCRK